MALHIYRVGRSVPVRSRNPIKSHVKIQLLTRTGRFGPVWPVWPGCRSSGGINFLIQTPNWTFYICISIVSTRSTQWYSPISILTMLARSVWPVRPDCPANSVFANFGCQHMPPYFLVKFAYQETSLKAQLHWNNENHLRQSCLAFKGDIEYRLYHLILLNIFTSVLLHAINASCVSEPSLSTYYLSCELLKHQLKSFSHL